ncbi:RNA polymerase sigma factor [Natronoflexus pectinivorans]|uniref:RNA polymerase sigma-70 factor (ECF subfamily) n=1 Tax=Natronoflexus pectinivorans TaxID=682526 RepID=A0A4R2GKL7_9BACT|nr:sigma-70 family RNA polymerase sigma factor [Natronoflexus pectinivorans]TCO09107.1 RNA polymerase sigma-70 factor (ECF subfamily) [Natronoflexus pectinivorans]
MTDLLKLSDEELVEGFVSGKQKCFDTLIERHKQKVFSYIFLMVRNQELAEDIFQDAFLKVHRTLMKGKYSESGRFASWVMRISHNLIIDHFRRQKHFPMVYNEDHSRDIFNHTKFSESTIEDRLVQEEVLKDVAELVELLPDNQKEVVKMRHYMGLSFKEISEETNVSINTALGRMRYALINLRKMMEERKISLSYT